jgi:hypothetical protein
MAFIFGTFNAECKRERMSIVRSIISRGMLRQQSYIGTQEEVREGKHLHQQLKLSATLIEL